MALLNAIDQATKQCDESDNTSESSLRAIAEARVVAQLKKDTAACDVLICLLAAAVCSPKGMSPSPSYFRANVVDVDRSRVIETIAALPAISSLELDILSLHASLQIASDWS
ncbi:hypothetical protein H310_07978 [Aphanomyces invadans]|uniref:PARP16 N-terminal domain-containing protein n=1 Tax=Aphanomyces invadans TaxID=157072 RepID=A0A024TYW0_9STRA|nr:hypothetical protein H310_07978 [Aphanomyces invadans]ETV99184.1 hypothetical protein H310_07978 [Aphanomyces invadans]|eukprot:XP_008871740.1 hypothetical protein H310_07978 [Aphanomyces invadans]